MIEFTDTSLRDVLDFLGEASGINVVYDQDFEDLTLSVTLAGVTFEEALSRILAANGAFHKVVDPRTIVVAPETAEKRGEYEELVIRTFYVSHGDVEALAELLATLVRLPNMQNEPQLAPNVEANAITVRASAPVVGIVERVLAANDKPRAEVVIDVEILEVNRERAKRYGLDLSRYSISTAFSPEGAPAAGGVRAGDDADGLLLAGRGHHVEEGVRLHLSQHAPSDAVGHVGDEPHVRVLQSLHNLINPSHVSSNAAEYRRKGDGVSSERAPRYCCSGSPKPLSTSCQTATTSPRKD